MPERDIFVIGASAGGVETLIQLCKKLPDHLKAALFVAIHLPITTPSLLPRILSRAGMLPAVHPKDGEPIQTDTIYVAPPDFHLEILPGFIHLSHGPTENGYRPSIDTLFRTAAQSYGPRVVGIVLSGMLSDGSLGLQAIHEVGGMTVVQDPQDALYPSMPESALRNGAIDKVLPLAGIAKEIVQLAGTPASLSQINPETNLAAPNIAVRARNDQKEFRQASDNSLRSLLTCPSCGGVLWEMHEGKQAVYICQTGHRFSLESMLENQSQAMETALWAAVRSLEERASLTHRLAETAANQGRNLTHKQFLTISEQAEQDAQSIRQILEQGKRPIPMSETEDKVASRSHEDGMV
jgi:two-component system chemotaxis response regulator CheB